MTDPEPIPVGAGSGAGSTRLAAALAAGDAEGIGRALRLDVVIVPLLRGADGTSQIRVFQPAGGGTELALFSSAATLAAFLAGDPQREFDVRLGSALLPFLAAHRSTISRIVLDPAGPHPIAAPVDAVIDALRPRDEDEAGWIAGAERDLGSAVDFRLAMPLAPWDRAVPADVLPARSRTTARLVKRVRRADPPGRDDVAAWVEDTSREWASSPGVREVALLVAGRADDALVVLASRYWITGHIDPLGEAGRALTGRAGDAVPFDAGGAVPGVRSIHSIPAARLPEGHATVIDYWLPFPDGQGVCLVRFASPPPAPAAELIMRCEPVVANGSWVTRRPG